MVYRLEWKFESDDKKAEPIGGYYEWPDGTSEAQIAADSEGKLKIILAAFFRTNATIEEQPAPP